MPIHAIWERGLALYLGRDWRAALLAALVAVTAVLAGRGLRLPALGAAACGFGVAAGFAVLGGVGFGTHTLLARLAPFALGALLLGLVAGHKAARGATGPVVIALALVGAWWLVALPLSPAGMLRAWRGFALLAIGIAAVSWLLAGTEAWRVAAAALALAASLSAAHAPPIWTLLALVPAGAALGALAAPGGPATLLPASAAIGALAAGAVLLAGGLARGRIGAVDLAALAPLATAFLAARLLPRLARLRGAAAPLAGLFALALVSFVAFSAAAIAGLR